LAVPKHVHHVPVPHMERVRRISVEGALICRRSSLCALNALEIEAAHLPERHDSLLQRPLGAMFWVAAIFRHFRRRRHPIKV